MKLNYYYLILFLFFLLLSPFTLSSTCLKVWWASYQEWQNQTKSNLKICKVSQDVFKQNRVVLVKNICNSDIVLKNLMISNCPNDKRHTKFINYKNKKYYCDNTIDLEGEFIKSNVIYSFVYYKDDQKCFLPSLMIENYFNRLQYNFEYLFDSLEKNI